MKYDLKGHTSIRPFYVKKKKNLRFLFCLNSNLIKTIYECLHYEDTIFYQMKYDLRGHGRSHKALLTKHIHLSTHFEKYFYEATNFSVYVQRKKY